MKTSITTEIQSRLDAEQRSRSWLADRLGISKSAISRKMSGATDFTVDEFLAVASALNVDAGNLIAAITDDRGAAA